MELIFLWIDEYFVLRNSSFNFSNQHLVDIRFLESEEKCQLTLKSNKRFVSNLFPGNILNVTAIVGVNGVGKSTLIDFILRIHHNSKTIGSNWVAVYKRGNDFFVSHQLAEYNKISGWKVSLVGGTDELIKAEIKTKSYSEIRYSTASYLPAIASIFYNPSLDLRDYKASLNSIERGIVDVGTNYLIWEDYENRTNDEYDNIENHRFKNTYRQFSLSQSPLIQFKDLKIPDYIDVRFNKNRNVDESDLSYGAKSIYKFLEESFRAEAHRANGPIEDTRRETHSDIHFRRILDKVKVWFAWNVVYDFFSTLSDAKLLKDHEIGVALDEVKGENALESAFRFFRLQKFAKAIDDYSFQQFIEEITGVIDSHAIGYRDMDDNESFFRIPVKNAMQVHQAHLKYRTLYSQSKTKSKGFLDLNWRDLSNGEKAYLDLYSRLFEGYRKLEPVLTGKSTLYVVIDEGEMGFHPQWQKEYLNNVIHFLNGLTNLKVQLIVTSHSPFLLSDLPKSNVILLNRDANNQTITDSVSVKEETFAANIHELFADSFFMRNGTIGDFAKRKIEEVIHLINRKEGLEADEIIRIKRLIRLVGEPVIRDRLNDMFIQRFGNRETLEERITRLQAELGKAQDELNTNTND